MHGLSSLFDSQGRRAVIGPGTIIAFNRDTRTLTVMHAADGWSGLRWPPEGAPDDKIEAPFIHHESDFQQFMLIVSNLLGLMLAPGPVLPSSWAVTFMLLPKDKPNPQPSVDEFFERH